VLSITKQKDTNNNKVHSNKMGNYWQKFKEYSFPLYSFAIIGMIAEILKRWLLQYYGGSIEQGYFSISNNISLLVILIAGSITPIILREFSIKAGNRDIKSLSIFINKYIPLFHSVACYFSIFLFFQTNKLVTIIGGAEFVDAKLPIAIMILYPIYYTTSNMIYSFIFSTNQTIVYRNIGIFFRILSIPIAFIILAPSEYYGFSGGAVGFALMQLVTTIISYNLYLWYSTKILQNTFSPIFIHQFVTIIVFSILGYGSVKIIDYFINEIYLSFFLSGVFYTALVILLTTFSSYIFKYHFSNFTKMIKIKF